MNKDEARSRAVKLAADLLKARSFDDADPWDERLRLWAIEARAIYGDLRTDRAASAAGDELQEALKPFADAGEALDKPHGIYFTKAEHERAIIYGISADDLRAAAAALHSIPCADEPDIFADALASQLDAIRRAAFDECIALMPEIEQRIMEAQLGEKIRDIIEAELIAARDATPTAMCSEAIPESGPAQCKHGHWLGSPEHPTTRSDKGKHHHVAGVLQEDVDEAEN